MHWVGAEHDTFGGGVAEGYILKSQMWVGHWDFTIQKGAGFIERSPKLSYIQCIFIEPNNLAQILGPLRRGQMYNDNIARIF